MQHDHWTNDDIDAFVNRGRVIRSLAFKQTLLALWSLLRLNDRRQTIAHAKTMSEHGQHHTCQNRALST